MFARSVLCFFGLTCSWTCLRRCGFSDKDVGMFFFSIASSNILTWTVGYSKLSSGNFYSIVLCSLGVHSILEDKVNFLLDTAMVCFFFFCACRLMRPLSKVETRRDSSSHNFVENMVILFHIRLRGLFLKNLSQ